MRIGSFSVQVPQGIEVGDGYVWMQHNTRYTIKMGNHGRRRVDAEVKVDGKFMGLFRIDPGAYLDLDRPEHDKSCFTFLKRDSQEGGDAGLHNVTKNDLGLIVVTFKPEKDTLTERNIERVDDRLDYRKGNLSLNDLEEKTRGEPREITRYTPGGPGGQTQCRARGGEYDDKSGTKGITRGFGFGAGSPPAGVEAGGTGLTGRSNTNFISVPELDYDPTLELPITLRLVADKAVRPLTEAPRGNPTPVPVD